MIIPADLAAFQSRPGASESEIVDLEFDLGVIVPGDYKSLLRESNGLEGFVVPGVYLAMWSVDDIRQLNIAYCVREFLPGVVLIGTDGADTGYGFTTSDGHVEYLSVPLVGMAPEQVCRIGMTFKDVLEHVRKGDP